MPDLTKKYCQRLSLQAWRARPKDTIALFPSVYTVAYATGRKCRHIYGAGLKSVIDVSDEKDLEVAMESQADYLEFSSRLVEKFQRQPGYLDRLIRWSEGQTNGLYDYISRNLGQQIIGSLSNQEIAEHYLLYVRKYLDYHLKNTPAWWLGAIAAEEKLRHYLAANYPELDTEQLLATIIEPLEYQSENFKEESSLLNIAIKLQKLQIKKLSAAKNLPPGLRAAWLRHLRSYESLPFGYRTGIVWGEKDFLRRLNVMLKNDPARLRQAKRQEIRVRMKRRDQAFQPLSLPVGLKNLTYALRKLSYLQELKKVTQTRSHPILQLVVKREIGRRLQLADKYLDYLSEIEIADALRSGRLDGRLRQDLIAREKGYVLIIRNKRYYWLTGRAAKRFIRVNHLLAKVERAREIKGQTASPGLVRGAVKICRLSTEIGKLKSGDILVTAMTTPDFVPAMRRAIAIVTDEGGITSHAAIVARELGKPCIIGAKIAVKALHDGDLVEVDATRGIIKVLKSKY
ncbi:MAG: PEP-utilizing enzyme [Patescibacteria group bacterium]